MNNIFTCALFFSFLFLSFSSHTFFGQVIKPGIENENVNGNETETKWKCNALTVRVMLL